MWPRIAAFLLVLVPAVGLSVALPAPPPAPGEQDGGERGPGVTAKGNSLFGEFIQKGVEELFRKLKLSDEVERQLLNFAPGWDGLGGEPDLMNVYLLRPGDADRRAETIEMTKDGRPVLRFTRLFGGAGRPTAIITQSRVSGGRVVQNEVVRRYGPDGKWQTERPDVSQATLKFDGR